MMPIPAIWALVAIFLDASIGVIYLCIFWFCIIVMTWGFLRLFRAIRLNMKYGRH